MNHIQVCTEENVIRGERRLGVLEKPVELQIKWNNENLHNNFYLRRKVGSRLTDCGDIQLCRSVEDALLTEMETSHSCN